MARLLLLLTTLVAMTLAGTTVIATTPAATTVANATTAAPTAAPPTSSAVPSDESDRAILITLSVVLGLAVVVILVGCCIGCAQSRRVLPTQPLVQREAAEVGFHMLPVTTPIGTPQPATFPTGVARLDYDKQK